VVLDSFYLSFVIVSNTTRMAHLKIINASRGPIHEYKNLKALVVFDSFYLSFVTG